MLSSTSAQKNHEILDRKTKIITRKEKPTFFNHFDVRENEGKPESCRNKSNRSEVRQIDLTFPKSGKLLLELCVNLGSTYSL